jgi:uncharacterized membrane protein
MMTAITIAPVFVHMDGTHWFLMALGLLGSVAVLIWLFATRAGEKHTGGAAPSEEVSALHLLDRRLAQGEIAAEEREDARRVLASEREHARI